ncbi:helix-turn-helix domain-containing protein [Bifidobacterium aquikefiricola]|uniref:Helix-turn-helix domain-containing protein n=1 Tax=Bifidobacterium aquikefiricola TaxID=3059038 RepID=A0AB39U857_9BIFI
MEILDKTDALELFVDDEAMAQDVTKVMNNVGDIRSDLALMANGKTIEMPHELSKLLLNILEALGKGTRISISTTPEEVSANTAADMLGVSRPTFLKWAKEHDTTFSRVGKQKRFLTSDVLKLRDIQREKKIAAFEALRKELDALE